MELHDMELPQRVLDKIVIHPETGCWLYQGCTTKDGYAQLRWNGKVDLFHRVMWREANGREIAPGMAIDHMNNDRGPCRFRNCGCPAHLQEVTREYNSSVVRNVNSEKTHCPQGHSYAEHGKMYQCRDGATRRFCMACRKDKRGRPC